MHFKNSLISRLIFLAGCMVSFVHQVAFCQPASPGSDTLRTLTVTGVGDIMFGTSYPSARYLPPHDNPLLLISEVSDSLAAADITFGNLEGSFLDGGEPAKRCRDTNICYIFRMPERYAGTLKASGFDLISLANNHFGDFGWPAAYRTMRLLDSLGIGYAGPSEARFSVIERGGLIAGFCAFSPTAGSISITDYAAAESLVKELAASCDVVIVSFHGGAEGSGYQRVPRSYEAFYGENRGNVFEFARRMVDSGADIIFGHGPHVPRAVEIYNGRLICYSLGNFCTYGRFNLAGPNGYAPVITVTTGPEGNFIKGRILPVYQGSDGRVRIDPARRAIAKIRELTAMDFPESPVFITEDGVIKYK